MKKNNSSQIVQSIVQLMRPPAGGIPVFSAGGGKDFLIQKKYYSLLGKKVESAEEISACWKSDINDFFSKKANPKVVLIGVPSDVGAGIRRGAAYGPLGIRNKLLENADYKNFIRSGAVIDFGDIFVNPHLLHDEMLNKKQIQLCQKQQYETAPAKLRAKLPVSVLSILEWVVSAIIKTSPNTKIYVLGGDHSVAWPVSKGVIEKYKSKIAIVQSDAHTDLLEYRHGVKYCFTTWTYHANQLLKKFHKNKFSPLVQVGIRQTKRDKKHWESTTGVKQYWAHDILASSSKKIIDAIVSDFKKNGIDAVYFSNDIDGTDESEALATGTPAPQGLKSDFLFELIDALGENFKIVAADVVEVAPDLADQRASDQTCNLAAHYTVACLKKMVR